MVLATSDGSELGRSMPVCPLQEGELVAREQQLQVRFHGLMGCACVQSTQ